MSNDKNSLDTIAQPSRYFLPFDGFLPALICGHPNTGKTSFLRHLLTSEGSGAQQTYVIDPSGSEWPLRGTKATIIRPSDFKTDAAFYRDAATMIGVAVGTPGSTLVVDDFGYLAGSYRDPMPNQVVFLDSFANALRVLPNQGSRVLVASTTVPTPDIVKPFGAKFFLGSANPIDLTVLYGTIDTKIASDGTPGTGILGLDGSFYPVVFPYIDDEQVGHEADVSGKRSLFGFGKRDS